MLYDSSTTADRRPRRTSLMSIAFHPWQMLASLMLQRRTYKSLSSLNDHLLKDIGISRGDIERISRHAAPVPFTSRFRR